MIIVLMEDYEIERDHRDDKVRIIPAGLKTNVINYQYLPPWYQEGWDRDNTIDKYYIIYYRSAFHRIPKETCNVTISEGWSYNI